uniref:Ribonuclease P/MRP protein subunit POP5 n=1 Tax=Sinocyclocheilus rhinocerous TaxID=307959 RepID=A0A673GA84_9TELE
FCDPSRYLLCEHTLRAAVSRAHGDYGSALFNIGVMVKYLNAHTGVVLIRSRKKHYRLIWSALSFITCLENRGQKVQCFLSCLHVGGKRGSVLTCQKFLVKYNRQQLHRMLLDCRTDAEKQEVRRAILSCSLSNVREEEADEDGSDDDGDEETQNPS